MYKIVILPIAKEDIKEATNWYNKQQIGLGKRFIQEINLKVAKIKQNPFIYSIRYSIVHTSVLYVFPFMIHYIIEEKNILIIAVLHTTRNPETWNYRASKG